MCFLGIAEKQKILDTDKKLGKNLLKFFCAVLAHKKCGIFFFYRRQKLGTKSESTVKISKRPTNIKKQR